MTESGKGFASSLAGRTLGVQDRTLRAVAAKYAWTAPVVGGLSLITSLLEGLAISLLVPLLGALSGHLVAPRLLSPLSGLFAWAGAQTTLVRLLVPAGLMMSLIVAKSAVQAANSVLIAWADSRVGGDLRNGCAARLLELGYAFTLGQSASRLVNIVSTDVWRATDAVRLLFAIVSAWGSVIVFSALLLGISTRLFVLVALGVLLVRGLQTLFARRMRRLGLTVSAANESLADRMLQVVMSMRLINLFGQESLEHRRFAEASDRVSGAMYDVQRLSSVVSPLFEILQAGLFILVLIVAYVMHLALPTIAAFLVLLYRMQPQITVIGQSRLTLASLRASITEVEWLMGPAEKPEAHPGRARPDFPSEPIVFDRVSFAYPGRERRETALSDLSFELRPGRVTALIGPSGAGKSTVVNLLCQLTSPSRGAIRWGPMDLRDIDPVYWRERISMAGQDIDLVDGTIADNIRYGRSDATLDEIREAARLADADGFIRALPGGYEARTGMRGLSLSGGQRQRISLARALLRRPAILILDEATNAVDGMSESTIMRLLHDHRCFQTALVISHRRSTLAACEDGIVIADGRLREAGPLRELDFYRLMEAAPLGASV